MPNHLLRGLGLLLVGATLNDLGRRLHERLLPAEEEPGRMIVQILGAGAGSSLWRDFGHNWSNSDPKRGDSLSFGPALDFNVTQVCLYPFANATVVQCHSERIDPELRRALVQRGFQQTLLSAILRELS